MVESAVREGSAAKRSAILDSARELFLRNGVDRVSMDAVAAHAAVSKRTVYDYFGDKRRLFLAILSDASESLTATGRQTLDEHLGDEAGITTVAELEKALTAVTIEFGSTVYSASYAAVFALVAQQRLSEPTTNDDLATNVIEELLEERIAHFAEVGLLDVDDPHLAATHFSALTVLLAYNDQPVPEHADATRVRQIMVDGVHAFIRAYGSRG